MLSESKPKRHTSSVNACNVCTIRAQLFPSHLMQEQVESIRCDVRSKSWSSRPGTDRVPRCLQHRSQGSPCCNGSIRVWFVHPEVLLSTLMVLLLPFAFCFFLLSFHQFSLICIFQFGRAARVTGMTRLTQIPVHESEGRTYAPKTKNFMVARRITSRTTFAQCAKAYEEAYECEPYASA